MEKEKVNPVTAVSAENLQDEGDIISDQDVTDQYKNPGADGSDNPSLSSLDVKAQMDRATRIMDHATGRDVREKKKAKPRKII